MDQKTYCVPVQRVYLGRDGTVCTHTVVHIRGRVYGLVPREVPSKRPAQRLVLPAAASAPCSGEGKEANHLLLVKHAIDSQRLAVAHMPSLSNCLPDETHNGEDSPVISEAIARTGDWCL